VAFAIVSVTAHWNEFLWPLMGTSSPFTQVLTVGLASFTAGAEAGSEWGIIAAGTFLVAAPLLVIFVLFQPQFVSSFTVTGIK
jgi:sn-glycerol 3-phosphate transport system permease protein